MIGLRLDAQQRSANEECAKHEQQPRNPHCDEAGLCSPAIDDMADGCGTSGYTRSHPSRGPRQCLGQPALVDCRLSDCDRRDQGRRNRHSTEKEQ